MYLLMNLQFRPGPERMACVPCSASARAAHQGAADPTLRMMSWVWLLLGVQLRLRSIIPGFSLCDTSHSKPETPN